MALISVNAGQCGNQLGFDFLQSIYENTSQDPEELEMFFRRPNAPNGKPIARAVCLDTEPKAVLSCLQRSARKEWAYDPSSCAYRHGGAGNNWAMGYQMCSGKFLDTSIDCIRRELEHCDLPPSILISHSIGGGTGSGLGTKITEVAADEFPDVTRLNAAVMPYHFGEVIVQHFNSVLCLSKVAHNSDGIMLFDNEIAHDMCKNGFGKDRPVLKDLNLAIAMGLVSSFLPKNTPGGSRSGQSNSLAMQISHMCAHPGYRFLDVKFVPQTSERSIEYTYDTWKALIGRLQAMQQRGTTSELQVSTSRSGSRPLTATTPPDPELAGRAACKTLSGVLTLRGQDADAAVSSMTINCADDSTPAPDYTISQSNSSSSASDGRVSRESRYRQSTRSSVARDASSYDRLSSNAALVFNVAPVNWNMPTPSFVPGGAAVETGPVNLYYSTHHVNGYQRSASIMSNGQSVLPYLKRPALKAAKMFSSGAYVHQYTDLGIERDEFQDAFLNIGQIIQNYQSL